MLDETYERNKLLVLECLNEYEPRTTNNLMEDIGRRLRISFTARNMRAHLERMQKENLVATYQEKTNGRILWVWGLVQPGA